MPRRAFAVGFVALFGLPVAAMATVVGDWNEAALTEVRASRFSPPVVARALAIAHTCMYEAWAPYDARAVGTVLGGSLRRPAGESNDANKAKAISYAAYGCLVNLFGDAAGRLQALMWAKGYDPGDTSTDVTRAQGIGNVAANAIIASRRNDGANQYGDLNGGAPYSDYTGYAPVNAPMPFCLPQSPGPCPVNVADPNRWQPLVNVAGVTQRFAAPFFERVRPFALSAANQFDGYAPPPNFLRGPTQYLADVNSAIQLSAALDLRRKLIVEYWALGAGTELPPGRWGQFAQFVSRRDGNSIDKDVKMFFALHNATFDAGIAAWHQKRLYEGVRPITAVRYLTQGTQIYAWGGPGQPSQSIAGEKWAPYNPGDNPTPSFPGYISGHSTFSSAGAAALKAFTGSDYFGYSTVIPACPVLGQPQCIGNIEPNIPPADTPFPFSPDPPYAPAPYATFSAAAAEAGVSRLYGGIHFNDDNTVGQTIGALVGQQAYAKAQFLVDGGLALEASSNRSSAMASTLVWSHTVSARSNRMLLVAVTYRDGNQPVVGVSYGGRALSRLVAQNAPGNQNRVEIWYALAPTPGTANVVVNLSNARAVIGGAASFTGVAQGAPFGVVRTASDQTQTACATLANAAAPLVVSVLGANGDARSAAPGSGQQSAWDTATGTAGGDIVGLGTTAATSPIATLCDTLGTAKPWALVAVPLNPAFPS
jgi:membrane-associated phospholipid phosphatase